MPHNSYTPEGFCGAAGAESFYTCAMLERGAVRGQIFEGRAAVCDESFSLTVELGCMKGIIPKEEIAFIPDGSPVKDIAAITRVGKPVCFKIKSFEKIGGENVAVLSRREAQKECLCEYLLLCNPGDIINARVTHLEPFGAFVDIGCGVVSLIPIDCISVSRISHPRDRFFPGMFIRTVIKSIDRSLFRISVSHKELLGTWLENTEKLRPGQTVPGIIRSVEQYGVFVELAPNLAGLAEYSPDVNIGDRATVYIKSIIPEKMKVKLVIVDTYGGCEPPLRPVYSVSDSHIDYWRYSPPECGKLVETVF